MFGPLSFSKDAHERNCKLDDDLRARAAAKPKLGPDVDFEAVRQAAAAKRRSVGGPITAHSTDEEINQRAENIARNVGLPQTAVLFIAQMLRNERRVAQLETRLMLLEQSLHDTSSVPPHMRNTERR